MGCAACGKARSMTKEQVKPNQVKEIPSRRQVTPNAQRQIDFRNRMRYVPNGNGK